MISLYKKVKVEEWVTPPSEKIVKEKYVLKPWVKFLRWLFADKWILEIESWEYRNTDKFSYWLDDLENKARRGKEHTMQHALLKLGYQLKSQFEVEINYDEDGIDIAPKIIDHGEPMFRVEAIPAKPIKD